MTLSSNFEFPRRMLIAASRNREKMDAGGIKNADDAQ
jgi:hypothetical protein